MSLIKNKHPIIILYNLIQYMNTHRQYLMLIHSHKQVHNYNNTIHCLHQNTNSNRRTIFKKNGKLWYKQYQKPYSDKNSKHKSVRDACLSPFNRMNHFDRYVLSKKRFLANCSTIYLYQDPCKNHQLVYKSG